ncbi:MAG: DUF2283 domain-containing protein [bacterium]
MKISYDRESDIMMLEVCGGTIDYAEELGSVIVHFTKEGKPVLLEILDASEILSLATKIGMRAEKEKLVEASI